MQQISLFYMVCFCCEINAGVLAILAHQACPDNYVRKGVRRNEGPPLYTLKILPLAILPVSCCALSKSN